MMAYWVSCERWTVLVRANEGRIVEAPPIARRFIGQPLENLFAWGRKLGGLRVHMLPTVGARHG